jgi:hypothetical protein
LPLKSEAHVVMMSPLIPAPASATVRGNGATPATSAAGHLVGRPPHAPQRRTLIITSCQNPGMSAVELLVSAVVLAVIVITIVGLATGRLDWRVNSCCPRDPADDLRMRISTTQETPRA